MFDVFDSTKFLQGTGDEALVIGVLTLGDMEPPWCRAWRGQADWSQMMMMMMMMMMMIMMMMMMIDS